MQHIRYLHKKQPLRWPIVAVLIILIAGSGYYLWHKYHSRYTEIHTNGSPITANPNVPGGTNPNPTGGSASKDEGSNQPGTPPGSSVQPAAPNGQFVSNHHASLSGKTAANIETSSCSTTPGVLCEIRFTMGSTIQQLPAQRTDGNGDTIWDAWQLQSIGLTQGSWTVSAIAINGTKTATAQDALKLVVSP